MSDHDDFYCILTDEEWNVLFGDNGRRAAILLIAEAAMAFLQAGRGNPREILRRKNKWMVVTRTDELTLYWNGTGWNTHKANAKEMGQDEALKEQKLARVDFPSAYMTSCVPDQSKEKKGESNHEAWARIGISYLREQDNQVSDQSKPMLADLFKCAMTDERERAFRERPELYVLKKEGLYNYVGGCGDDYCAPDLEKAVILTESQAREKLSCDRFHGFTMVSYYDELNRTKS